MTTIATTDTELQHLRRTVDGARPATENVTVSKEALRHLLDDHHTLWTALRERKALQITAGADQGSLL
jgi:hypothetical protein